MLVQAECVRSATFASTGVICRRRIFAVRLMAALFLTACVLVGMRCCLAIDPVEQAYIVAEHVFNDACYFAEGGGYATLAKHEDRASLDASSQRAYDVLYKAAFLERESVMIDGLTCEEAIDLMYIVWYDSPELFYVDPAVKVSTVTTAVIAEHSVSTVEFYYLFTGDDLAAARAGYLWEIGDAAKAVEGSISDADKVNAINQWVIDHVSYDEAAASMIAGGYSKLEESDDEEGWEAATDFPAASTAYGALHDGLAVCGGYAQLFCALCRESGIGCRTVVGSVDGFDGAHAWNAVRLADEWFYVDTVWNDAADAADFTDDRCMADESVLSKWGYHPFAGNVPPLNSHLVSI